MDQEAIKTLMEWATQIKDGVSAELPKLAAEIVAFELWSSLGWMLVCVVTFPTCIVLSMWAWSKEMFTHDHPGYFTVYVVSLALSVLSLVGVVGNAHDALKAYVAPRLVVVEKVVKVCK